MGFEAPRIVEGTWEEVASRADEFRGQRVRLLVLPRETPEAQTLIRFGQLREVLGELTDDDFHAAEWHPADDENDR
jgi:hypothetical protein